MKIEMIVNHPSLDPSKSQVKSAIFKSVSTKNIEAFRVLLPLIRILSQMSNLAATAKNMKIFKEIIDLNAIDINSSDDQGETPLFYAARSRNGSSVQQLFLRENLDFAHKNNAGMDVIKCVKIILQNNNIGVDHDVDAHINTKGEYLSELMSLINLYDTYRH